ncbi:MAG: 3'(2'),5'-bisphosphate nucleotidase [Candidatus Hinthialibacter antarcticus]|nr:3'(2'),5'-bisphosphate nucleotidase [Candidatus Hinthialibacter antarcticus]
MNYEKERQVALDAVCAASRLCQRVQQTLVTGETLTKKDRSPVTVADFGSQAVASLRLLAAFPDIPIVGEEDAGDLRKDENTVLRQRVLECAAPEANGASEEEILAVIDKGNAAGGASGRFWTIDPIDGTKGFLRAEQYAVALALIEDGEVVLGVLGCPNLPVDPKQPDGDKGCMFVGVKGCGAVQMTLNQTDETPIRVSDISDPGSASFVESVESGHTSHGHAQQIAGRLGVVNPPVRMDSQCKYAAVARGEASIYLRLPSRANYVEKIWDHAAGVIVIQEAGGVVSDVNGKPLDFSQGRGLESNQGVVASNGKFQSKIVDAVKDVFSNR